MIATYETISFEMIDNKVCDVFVHTQFFILLHVDVVIKLWEYSAIYTSHEFPLDVRMEGYMIHAVVYIQDL